MSHEHGIGYQEDGTRVPCVEFDYDLVERDLFKTCEHDISRMTQEDVDRALAVLTVLLAWIWQSGFKNPRGLMIRSIIICWIFLQPLRGLQLSELARRCGMKKQSLGRWVDRFKKDFPKIRTSHMRGKRNLVSRRTAM